MASVTADNITVMDAGMALIREINKVDEPYKKYWIINPYLSFSGQVIKSDVRHLFQGTHISKAFNDPLYKYRK
jgi:hypothetical protein